MLPCIFTTSDIRSWPLTVRRNASTPVLPYVTEAQIGDSTNESFLSSLGIRNFDACIVAIGDNFQSSLETTSLLKELGAKLVVSRASSDVHQKFLLRNGADQVVYPEHSLQNGLRSASAPTTFLILSIWRATTISMRLIFRNDGLA